jgi:hypothetical protein
MHDQKNLNHFYYSKMAKFTNIKFPQMERWNICCLLDAWQNFKNLTFIIQKGKILEIYDLHKLRWNIWCLLDWLNIEYGHLFKIFNFLLPQASGLACVDFWCIQFMGCFEIYPSTCWVFFSRYECWVTNLIMPLYHFIFLGCHLLFLYHKVS